MCRVCHDFDMPIREVSNLDRAFSFEVRHATSPIDHVSVDTSWSSSSWTASPTETCVESPSLRSLPHLWQPWLSRGQRRISNASTWRHDSPCSVGQNIKIEPILAEELCRGLDLNAASLRKVTKQGVFTSEISLAEHPERYATRYHKITGITAEDFEQEQFSRGFYGSIKGELQYNPIVGVQKITHLGITYIRFNSVTDSAEAWRLCDGSSRHHGLSFSVQFVTAEEYHQSQMADNGNRTARVISNSSLHRLGQVREGEIMLKLICIPASQECKAVDVDFLINLREQLINFLEQFDRVIAFEYSSIHEGKLVVRVETDSILAGDKIVKFVQGKQITIARSLNPSENLVVELSACHWDLSQNPDNWLSRDVVAIARHDNNRVIYERVSSGQDCRTSVMLRDLPNRMSFFEVRRLLDHISPGRYDFSYLRIDFENQHNVGYVFINFLTADDILPFMKRVVGHRWQIYSSEKIAQLSYANIQGREALAERFKNSAVITAWSCFRPKQWESELDGGYEPHRTPAEQPFPVVTNQAKFERSISNQTVVGLYAPGHKGPNFPNQSRRRLVRNNGLSDLSNDANLHAFPKNVHHSAPFFHHSDRQYPRVDTTSLPELFEGLSYRVM